MKYPLQTDNFSFLDRLKVALFVLNKKNRLTSGPCVEKFEKEWEEIASWPGVSCVSTSSGSTANHLLVETFLQSNNFDPKKVTVFCPSTTWSASVTPWIMRGCEIVFIDINLKDFSFNYEELSSELELRKDDGKIKVIWPTALIGFVPNIKKLNDLKNKYKTYLFADLCETTFGWHEGQNILSCFDMATTSYFFAHEITSLEGGMLFIRKDLKNFEQLYENAKMIRSHGLIRVLNKHNYTRQTVERQNPDIDPEFLFDKIGTNYRLTDLNAFFGLLDTKRYYKYIKHRRKVWKYFCDKAVKHSVFLQLNDEIIPFCLPIIYTKNKNIKSIKQELNKKGWETRPIICFLPINPAFKKYSNGKQYPNSQFLHEQGFYVGLNKNIKIKDIDILFESL